MPYQPITKDKVCNWTFVKESDLPDGEKLHGCARCRECWYKDRECQEKHWSYHKKTCKSIAEEPRRDLLDTEVPSIYYCVDIIVTALESAQHHGISGGRLLLHGFRHLQRLLIQEEGGPQNNQEAIILSIGNAFFGNIKGKGRSALLDIWAIPGWATFFLSEDLFLSPEMKRRKDLGIPAGQPKEEIVRENRCLPLVYVKLCFIIYANTALRNEDGQQIHHSDHLAAALVRSTNRAWMSEYVRESLPKNEEFIDQTFKSNFSQPIFSNVLRKHCRPDELIPGLTAKQLLTMLIKKDAPLQGIGEKHRSSFYGEVYVFGAYFEDNKHLPWRHLAAKDRIELLDMSHDWDAQKIKFLNHPAEFFTDLRTCVLHMITGCQAKTLLEIYYLCQTMSPAPDERTVQMIKNIRNAMLEQYLPKVAIYSEVIEPKARAKGTDQAFPDVLNTLIAEFTFGQKYIWASGKRKGLHFLTESELEEQHRFVRSIVGSLLKKHKENIYDTTPGVPVYDVDGEVLS
jgi:hypothetical protein